MNPKPLTPAPGPSISGRDIYYVIYRYKWMIGVLVVAAVAGAIAFRELFPVSYSSEARLLIKYVVDTKPLTAEGTDAQVTYTSSGDAILGAEQEMLTSLDVCRKVAENIGPGKILPSGDATNATAAALAVQRGLAPLRERNSDVIHIIFSNPDRDIVQPVLSQIILAYEAEHNEVRRPKNSQSLSKDIETVRDRVRQDEGDLKAERSKAGIVSLEDSKKVAAQRVAGIESSLNEVEMNMQVAMMRLRELKKDLPAMPGSHQTNGAPGQSNEPAEPPLSVALDYRRASTILASLQTKESELLTWTTTNNPQVQSVETQIANTEERLNKLVDKYPSLISMKPTGTGPAAADPVALYHAEELRAEELGIRFHSLTNMLADAKINQGRIIDEEGRIIDLERQSDRDRANLDYYQKRLSESEMDAILGPGDSRFNLIEEPTPPLGDTAKLNKMFAGILFGGLVLAFGLPFVLEFYVDQSLKRPLDIQNRLGVPFFVSMPKLKAKSQRAALKGGKKVSLLTASTGDAPAPASPQTPPASSPTASSAPATNGHVAPWEQRHGLRPFFETLRDRLMTYFEVINLTHKPKLVAVTSCGEGAGVTTTAAGLASALSETGDGNVLLVNMNGQDGEAHHFYRGRLTCGLEEALEQDKRNAACIQDNLFVAKDLDINENLPRVLPKRFSHLVPKMRASDYDYIIFDMPPMSQISITPRLARFMDMVLLVIESEKTDRDVAKRATNLLLETKTNVGVVLNKNRDDLPRRLQQDI